MELWSVRNSYVFINVYYINIVIVIIFYIECTLTKSYTKTKLLKTVFQNTTMEKKIVTAH